MNIDLTVLCLTLGIPKTAYLLQTSEESLHTVIKSFIPENQRFFMFIKDCLLSFVKKVGNKTAEERLNISSFVLDKIMQDIDDPIVKQQKKSEPVSRKYTETTQAPKYNESFKQMIMEHYNTCFDVKLTASKFSLSIDLVQSWVEESKT